MDPALFAIPGARPPFALDGPPPLLEQSGASFSVDGPLAGPAYSVAISAVGGLCLTPHELRLALSPPILGLPLWIVLRTLDIVPESLALCEPLFYPRHVTGVVRMPGTGIRARFKVDVQGAGKTKTLFDALQGAVVAEHEEERLFEARADHIHSGHLVPTGKHVALVDPRAPATLMLTDEVKPCTVCGPPHHGAARELPLT